MKLHDAAENEARAAADTTPGVATRKKGQYLLMASANLPTGDAAQPAIPDGVPADFGPR